jgi:hypothetical protein
MTKKLFISSVTITIVASLAFLNLTAQNSSPYWSLAGNNNATNNSKLGTTNNIPLKFFTNNSQRIIIDSLGKVGIGITKPVNIFTVKSGGGTPAASWLNGLNTPVFVGFGETVSSEFLLAGASNTVSNRAVFQGRRSRGTLASPTAVANNDYITSLLASAYDGSTFQNPALVSFFVDGTPSAGNVPTRISFVTGSNIDNRAERLKVGSTGNFTFNNGQLFLQQSNGSLGVGTSAPDASALLDIKSTTKGFLMPRMTQAQRDAITSPATGLLVYQTNNSPGFYYYTGSAWTAVKPTGGGGSGWSLTGNAGTTPSTNFIGTSDAKSLEFKVNNFRAGLIDYSTCCSGTRNTAFGQVALNFITSGADNTATGYGALYTNTTGNQNVAYGKYALYNNNADNNTAYGFNTMFFNTTGANNTAIGSVALQNNISGQQNTATGFAALASNNGSYNSAYGAAAMNNNASGFYNTATGSYALYYNTTGSNNVANGYGALYNNTTGYSNVAIGINALYNNVAAGNLVAIGDSALFYNGIRDEEFIVPEAFGNTAVGSKALYSNRTGQANTAMGFLSLTDAGSGNNNTAFGSYSLATNTFGDGNTGVGTAALYGNYYGHYNSALGVSAGTTNFNYTTAVGCYANTTASNQVRIGSVGLMGTDPTSIGGKVDWSTLSDGRVKKNIKTNVPGLDFINKLKPVTYNIDNNAINKVVQRPVIKDRDGKEIKFADELAADKANAAVVYTGFVAQDVEKAAKELNYDFSGVDAAKNDKDLYGLRYAEFVVPLVKAVQELSKMNQDKDAKISALETRLEKLEALLKINSYTTILSGATLEQNTPNPFRKNTIINYSLPQTFTTAQIKITDINGKILKTINISGSGKGLLNVDAAILSSGAYNYSLFLNDRLISTKQMERLK